MIYNHGAIPLGLYRMKNSTLGNKEPFVYTNPLPHIPVISSDLVYVLLPNKTKKKNANIANILLEGQKERQRETRKGSQKDEKTDEQKGVQESKPKEEVEEEEEEEDQGKK
jgi:hypothetical protein